MKGHFWLLLSCCNPVLAFVQTLQSPAARLQRLFSEADNNNVLLPPSLKPKFNLTAALFCAGLAFDAYAEPPSNSSRWERGSQGMNVAFQSNAFTRNLYKGLVEVTPIRCTDLPDEDNTAEGIMSGGGTDAYLLVAAVEGQWEQDVELLETKTYHDGVLGLLGAAHVGRSETAWSNVNKAVSDTKKRKTGKAVPYHVPSKWGKGGEAVWPEHAPFYLYVQDPATVRLVFTVMDDDVVGGGGPIGSAHRKLVDLIPLAKLSGQELVDRVKAKMMEKIKAGADPDSLDAIKWDSKGWSGVIPLTSKPYKKDKGGQMIIGAAAGAYVAGPVGAAVGGLLGSMYEGQVRGKIELRLRYVPIPPVDVQRKRYAVKGGLPGVDWGEMYDKYLERNKLDILPIADGEQCFIINHDETGGSCAVYRSLERRLIVVSFRGTCQPVDLITDASIAQDAWVEGEDVKNKDIPKVHSGFRKSMNSISRRLKELILATPAPGEDISHYDMLVTGHSLGGALATLFVMDIAESGIDAGRALPQMDPSDDWWKSITSTFMGDKDKDKKKGIAPPRPKSLRMYNFGSPRVGNKAFADAFGALQKQGHISEAYRIVNGNDVVPRTPRTINALAFGFIDYEHCGSTALVSLSSTAGDDEDGEPIITPKLWIEGESDDSACPVRDGTPLTSPLAHGSLLSELVERAQGTLGEEVDKSDMMAYVSNLPKLATIVSDRLKKVTTTDITSLLGIEREFTQREITMIQSIFSGEAIKHHLEPDYYTAVGRACGFDARVGETLTEIVEEKASATPQLEDNL